ncbi:hypothetical protein [Kibdelosporangium philippinense]
MGPGVAPLLNPASRAGACRTEFELEELERAKVVRRLRASS